MKWIVGVDEVGRGPIAGPVTVCAAAMPFRVYRNTRWQKGPVGLTDSKLMTALARDAWYQKVTGLAKDGTLRFSVVSVPASAIDSRGISACIRSCIARALKKLSIDPRDCIVLLDGGLAAPSDYARQETVIKGDRHHRIISLASVIAKVTRDQYMILQHRRFPRYGWERNKGYGTASHYGALATYGPCDMHRKSFITKVKC